MVVHEQADGTDSEAGQPPTPPRMGCEYRGL